MSNFNNNNNSMGSGGDAGEIQIFARKIQGDGKILAEGGDGFIGGKGGKISIISDTNEFTGNISTKGGRSISNKVKKGIKIGKIKEEHPVCFWIGKILIIIGILTGLIELGQFLGFLPESLHKSVPQVSVFDVQYELIDKDGSVIRRKGWQDNSVLDGDSRNIEKMFVSIKLRNSSDYQVFSRVENYKEIFNNAYVIEKSGDFFDKMYSIPANGDSGFLFAIDISPFTRVNPLRLISSEKTQNIKFYDENGKYVDVAQINIANTYGITIPYTIGIYDKNKKLTDTLNFEVLCRAQISELQAQFNKEGNMDLTKALNFECLPTK